MKKRDVWVWFCKEHGSITVEELEEPDSELYHRVVIVTDSGTSRRVVRKSTPLQRQVRVHIWEGQYDGRA